MTRLEANEEILKGIQHYIRKYPDMRFGQALFNLGIATHCREEHLTEAGTEAIKLGTILDSNHVKVVHRDIFFEESEDTLAKLNYGNDDTGSSIS